MKSINISVVIPVFNEAERIGKVIRNIGKYNLEMVVVDDGSTDNTIEIILKSEIRNPKLKVLRHKVNLGKGAAMKTGAEFAFKEGADAVVFMDSDGQHDPLDLKKFISELEKGNSFVIGSRNLSYGVPLIRYLGNKFASLLVAFLFHSYVSDLLCGFRAMTKDTYKRIIWDSAGYAVETEMIVNAAKKGVNITEIQIKTVYLDSVKGVTILDAVNILVDVVFWRFTK
jgi:glycosyltransferase involved in cell wall biosynthesis